MNQRCLSNKLMRLEGLPFGLRCGLPAPSVVLKHQFSVQHAFLIGLGIGTEGIKYHFHRTLRLFERRSYRKTDLPYSGSVLKWCKYSALGQVQARSLGLVLGLPDTWAISCCFPRCISRELDQKCPHWDAGETVVAVLVTPEFLHEQAESRLPPAQAV